MLDEQAGQAPRRQADRVGLQGAEVDRRVALLAFEHLADALVARGVNELAGQEMRTALTDVVVRIGPQAVGRVDGSRAVLEPQRPPPRVLTTPAGRRYGPFAAVTHRYVPAHLIAG